MKQKNKKRKKTSSALENKNKSGEYIKSIVGIFLFLMLLSSIFLGKEFLLPHHDIKEGLISSRDVYAPFDFKFQDKDGVVNEVQKNELIIQKGERINKSQELAAAALSKIQKQIKNIYYFLGIFLLLIIFSIITVTYNNVYSPEMLKSPKIVLLLCLLILLIVTVSKAVIFSSWSMYAIPLASISMLVAILINPGEAVMITVILSFYIGVLAGVKFDLALTLLAGGIVGIYSVLNVRKRRDLTKAGVLVGLSQMVSIVSVGLINFIPMNNLIPDSLWGLASGIVSAIVVTGILPVFEMAFGLTTNISLLELSDLNQPILKELVLKAPGTYHHSLLVGNLAESAAEVVGANSLLARVGAYFHDIGKLRMAPYFSENQTYTENKHDNLSPKISSLIIINHIKEGADLAKKYKLGQPIIDIITQHHGNDLVHFFYHRALEQQDEESPKVQAEDFRYPGPRPQSKEAAIVMLADSVEAASRTLQQPTPAKIQGLVGRIINNKFIDGQLDGCSLTLKDLHDISEVFTHILTGIFHSRVEYPDLRQITNEQNKNKESAEKGKAQPKENKKPGE